VNIYINNTGCTPPGQGHTREGRRRDGRHPAIAGGAVALTPEQVNRYSRHIIMPQVGPPVSAS
jgi:ribosomal protein L4